MTAAARPIHTGLLVAFAVFVTLFLFFIDEGRYTLSGLEETGNIVAMSLYLIGQLLGLFIMNALIGARMSGIGRALLVCGVGMVLGIALTIGGLWLMGSASVRG